jgi:uncharacterized protein YbjT (DUF2867 family)
MSIQHVAVIGGTGQLGKPVVRELVQAGFTVTVLVRKAELARQLFGDTVRIVTADLADAKSLRAGLQGQDALYLNLSVDPGSKITDWQPEREGLQSVLQIARELNVQRVVYLSSMVMHYAKSKWWVFKVKHRADELVKTSGIPHTILKPSMFLDVLDGNQRKGNALLATGPGANLLYPIAGEDYGKQVAAALRLPTAANRIYTVQGPEQLSAGQAAERYVRAYPHSKLAIKKLPFGLVRVLSLFIPMMDYLKHIVTAIENHPEPFQSQQTWDELGKPTITVEEFARSRKPWAGK